MLYQKYMYNYIDNQYTMFDIIQYNMQVYLQVHELCIVCITCINILTLDNQYTMFDFIQYNMHNV